MQMKDKHGGLVEWYWQEYTEVLREKTVPVPIFPPQITRGWPGIELEPSR
jgi:hypothetical protein